MQLYVVFNIKWVLLEANKDTNNDIPAFMNEETYIPHICMTKYILVPLDAGTRSSKVPDSE